MKTSKKFLIITAASIICLILKIEIPMSVSIAVILAMLIIVGISDRFKLLSEEKD